MIGEHATRRRNHMDCWSGGFQCLLDDEYCPMAPKREYVKWYGRWPDPRANGSPYVWIPERVPMGLTPWNWPDMPWTPADIWLPHPPVRGRGHKSGRPAPM